MTTEKLYIKGTTNLLKSLDLGIRGSLIIVSSEGNKEFLNYILKAMKLEKIENIIFIMLPDILRPITEIPIPLKGAIEKSSALIHIVNRVAEENFTFNRPLQDLCISKKCKYIYIYDAKLQYLKEGIAADYNAVEKIVGTT